jgi:plastocyanin
VGERELATRWRAVSALVVVALTVACGGGSRAPATPSTAPRTSGASATVQVQDNIFAPEVLTVAAGAVVQWRWTGENLHNVTGDDFASLSQGSGVFDRPFARPGTYYYRCTLHTHMLGEVVVR